MSWIFISFLSVTVLFFLFLGVKKLLKLSICPLCFAVSLTWLWLLAFSMWWGAGDSILVAVFMGQSVLGILLLAEKKFPDALSLFRLPILLSLTFLVYASITKEFSLEAVLFLLATWTFFGMLKLWENPFARSLVQRLVSCCKDW
ncbi:MAG: hypothetical protein Q8P71_00730 [bacterium]|nr:hypothetical protein [bacterium]